MTAKNTSVFSVRLTIEERELLRAIAKYTGESGAALARKMILTGLRSELDPEEISRRCDEDKVKLLKTAELLRQQHPNALYTE